MTFTHQQAAHCESGVISALLSQHGLAISEPMAFGLANALAFAYIPIIKIGGQPLIAYRLPPKAIIKNVCKRLGVTVKFQKFNDPIRGAQVLDDLVERGTLVGLQTSVYYLPYFPEQMRFHFNAHNLLIYGKGERGYQVSDPIFEQPVEVASRDLNKARFVRGPLAPKGLLYRIESVPETIDYPKAIRAAISKNVKVMTGAPLPVIGIKGVRYLAGKIDKLSGSVKQQRLYLGHIVRMQEEIGTGGAGFRFIYASFLQEAAELLQDDTLAQASAAMTDAGDYWREFALLVARECKRGDSINRALLADALRGCADREAVVWQSLKAWCKAG
ncbi:BtrH N-terminal domain-containing protein [Gilvimarinus polysaccharolyticus]|uniref:BtrH N-terminal domain-containing protein n=1 Tax=Gilvimarinus polysaccharolyticus TaxID=863921 RepID=UPI00067392B5|nr:BtrH N-terminal domain-containing protein [Gilvimarinus polysaccharolyticus]